MLMCKYIKRDGYGSSLLIWDALVYAYFLGWLEIVLGGLNALVCAGWPGVLEVD